MVKTQQRTCSALRNLFPKLLDDNDELILDLKTIKSTSTEHIKAEVNCPIDKATMLKNIAEIDNAIQMYDYFSNSLLVFEGRAYFYRISGNKRTRFTNICRDGNSEWDQKIG